MAGAKRTKPKKKKTQNAGGRKKRTIKNPSGDSTIFDDVFKTIIEKFPWLLVPLINEVFGTDYGENEIVKLERTEYQTPKGRRTMDSYFHIRDKTYHIECQSTKDKFIIIRIIEYDFHAALDEAREKLWEELQKDREKRSSEPIKVNFPQSCIVYLRHDSNTPDSVELDVSIPGNDAVRYRVPIVKVQNYTKDAIFQKRLLMLLPFYILKYEDKIKAGKEDFLDEWEEEYTGIINLIREEKTEDIGGLYEQLIELIKKVSEYVGSKNKAFMERVESIMGGQVMELETGKAWDRGVQQGIQQGMQQGIQQGVQQGIRQGIQQGVQQGIQQGRAEEIVRLGYEFKLSEKDILSRLQSRLDISLQEAQEYLSIYGKQTV